MESLEDTKPQIYEVTNQRRVITSLKKFTDLFRTRSESQYAQANMGGRFSVSSVEGLSQSCIINTANQPVKYVETAYGINDSEYFSFGSQEFIVSGLDDGTIQIFDYGKNKSKPQAERPIFKVQKDGANAHSDLDHPYDIFRESLYEHEDSVLCIEKNFKDQTSFLTAGKDSNLLTWKFVEGSDSVLFQEEIDAQMLLKGTYTGGITSAKWFDERVVILGLTDGTVQLKDLREEAKSKTLLLHQSDSAVRDLKLWKKADGVTAFVGEDSGRVIQIDPRKPLESTLVTKQPHQSILRLSIDTISKTNETLLTVGSSKSISVFDLASSGINLRLSPVQTSDNVSSVKAVWDKTLNSTVVLFGTYNGRLNLVKL